VRKAEEILRKFEEETNVVDLGAESQSVVGVITNLEAN